MNNENKLTESQALKAREIDSVLRNFISIEGQKPIYGAMCVDKDTFSRFHGNKNKKALNIKHIGEMIALLGLELVPEGSRVCPPDCIPVEREVAELAVSMLKAAYGSGVKIKEWERKYKTSVGEND